MSQATPPTRKRKTGRNQDIVNCIMNDGSTYGAMASKHGISYTRVSQIYHRQLKLDRAEGLKE